MKKPEPTDVETPPVEQQREPNAQPAPANPHEGGSYIRQPDGTLVKQEG